MRNDMLKKAEAFVDKVVAPARRRQAIDSKTITAKTDLARKTWNLPGPVSPAAGSTFGVSTSSLRSDRRSAKRSPISRATMPSPPRARPRLD